MKASNILLAGVLPTALANNALVVRQSSSVASNIADQLYIISNATSAVNDVITNFVVTDLIDLQTVSGAVVADIYSANRTISTYGKIDGTDGPGTLALLGAITTLATLVNTTIDNLIAHKSDLGGAVPVVEYSLQLQNNATGTLNALVLTKLPNQAFINLSLNATKPIIIALQSGIAAFSTVTPNAPSEFDSAASSLLAGILPVGTAILIGLCFL